MLRRFRESVILLTFALTLLSNATVGQSNSEWNPNVSPLPPPTGFVNDYVGVIDSATKQALETKLRAFRDKTGVEIGVAIVRTTGDRDIFDYSLAVARGWKIGAKADDNPSALLFIAIDDRKYFTQISRDLEDELPDSLAGSIQRTYLVPEFRKGNYAKGISDTIDAYIATIEKRLSSSPAQTPVSGDENNNDTEIISTGSCCALSLLIIVMWYLFSPTKRGRGGGSGITDAVGPYIIGSILSSSSSSSDSSWGSSSSSSSDWGGFGGFGGGGDFGGGGSGGSW